MTKADFESKGFKVYPQVEGGEIAFVVENKHVSMICIKQVDGSLKLDYDSEIYFKEKENETDDTETAI